MKKYKGTFDIPGGFSNKGNSPISDDMVVENFNDLLNVAAFPFLYPGMIVYCEETETHYTWNGQDRTQPENWKTFGGLFINTSNPPQTIGGFKAGEPATPPEGLSIQQSLNKLLFPSVSPSVSFTASGNSVYLEPAPTINLSWSITIRTANASLATVLVEFRRESGNWNTLYSYDAEVNNSIPLNSLEQNNTGNNAIEDYDYRITVTDSTGASQVVSKTVTTTQVGYFGWSNRTSFTADLLNDANINRELLTSKSKTFNNINPGDSEFVYYIYPNRFGDLTSAIQNGAAPVLGSFTKILSAVEITNDFGQIDTYNVYKSNADNAFSGDSVNFS